MSCDGNCSATETAMFMAQSRKEGYDEGYESGHEDKLADYEALVKAATDYFVAHDSKLFPKSDYIGKVAFASTALRAALETVKHE